MHLKEIIFFAGRHLFRVCVIIIQIHLFWTQMKTRRYMRPQRQTFSAENSVCLASSFNAYPRASHELFSLTEYQNYLLFQTTNT